MSLRERSPTTIDTKSGCVIDFANPDPSQIRLDDIAAGLALVCRFGGQALAFYSVAQHAVLVKQLVERRGRPDLGLSALHHDSHEAYACDIPKPLKTLLPDYDEITARLDEAIGIALGLGALSDADAHVIKDADTEAFGIEQESLLNVGGRHNHQDGQVDSITVHGERLALLPPPAAEEQFLGAHERAFRPSRTS